MPTASTWTPTAWLRTITWRAHVDLRDLAQRERLMVVAGMSIRSAPAVVARAPSPPAAAPSLPVAAPMPPVAPAPAAAPSPSVAAGAAPLEEPVPIERYAAVVAEIADKGALRSKVLSEARRGSAANEHSRREPHAPIGPPSIPWKRSEIVRDRPRESSLARDVLDIARMPWRARCARSRRPAGHVHGFIEERQPFLYPPASFLRQKRTTTRCPCRARTYDRNTSSFKDNPSQPRPTYFRDGTIPSRMHDLRRKTNTDVHGSIPHVRSAVCTSRYMGSTKRLLKNYTAAEPIREHGKREDMPTLARIITTRQRHQSRDHTSKNWNNADQEGSLPLLAHTTMDAHSHHTD
ncbi:hypothetical protein WME75_18215 [Sorangium sp. So ce1014]|uniref:hypothetical protein n=1 Tax=Sorangium sp. So ce1014 TaxID=3133326 RepID=UPI003F627AEA